MIKLLTVTIDDRQYNLTLPLLGVTFILWVLKSLGVPMSWWMVFAPIWIVPAFFMGIFAFCVAVIFVAFIVACFTGTIKDWKFTRK